MVTFTNALANKAQQWCVIVQIDGVGPWHTSANLTALDSDGRTRFCTQIPDYADTSTGGWRTDLVTDPDLLGEIPDTLGGRTEAGSLEFAILDKDNYFTDLVRVEQAPVAILNGDINSSTTSVVVLDDNAFATSSPFDVAYVGSEALYVTAVSANTLTVTRSYLNTQARSHDDGDAVFLYNYFLKGRRASLKIVPKDGDDSGEEQTEITGKIYWWGWDPLTNMWRFRVKTQNAYLDRAAPLDPRSIVVLHNTATKLEEIGGRPYPEDVNAIQIEQSAGDISDMQIWSGNTESLFYLHSQNTGEVVGAINPFPGLTIQHALELKRGLVGTSASQRIEAGDVLTQVFVADKRDSEGSFRFSPGGSPSTSRSSGTWTQTMHWCDICRIIMTSQANEDDDLTIATNYIAASGNFASLPEGYGLGIPSNSTTNLIDHDSWADVKSRTNDCVFPNFVYGAEPIPFLDLIAENFLKPLGAYIVFRGGTAKIILPRVPLAGSSTVTLGEAQFLRRAVAPRVYEPRINKIEMDVSAHTGSLIYKLGPNEYPLAIQSGTYKGTYGQRGDYGNDDHPTEISVPGADYQHVFLWTGVGESRLYRRHKPRKTIDADFDFSTYTATVGDVASITLSEIPNNDGTRDASGELAEIEEREPVMQKDEFFVRLKTRCYGAGLKVAAICPAAYINDDTSAPTVTVDANRFTKSDSTGGLPTTDAGAFTVTDVVRLVGLDGVDSGQGTETVDNISGNDITLSGDFNGTLDGLGGGNGWIIVYAFADDVTSTQTTNYAFMSDKSRVGVDGVDPYTYGEP